MDNLIYGIGLALWFGILTAISPCPLTTNIAAMSFISKKVGSTKNVLLSGFLYTLGRIVAYTILGFVLVKGVISIPGLSIFLQRYANKLLGPILILLGMVIVELIDLDFSFSAGGASLKEKIENGGLWWSPVLGFIFALSFCPPSAALFFGSVIPLSMKYGSLLLIPIAYGTGTGLPVLAFSVAIAKSAQTLAKAFEKVQLFEWWARRVTGVIFICAGIYLSLVYVHQVL